MARYIIWNKDKVAWHTELDASTYAGLIDAEKKENAGISSEIQTHDINEFIQAVYNETDIELCYIRIEKCLS